MRVKNVGNDIMAAMVKGYGEKFPGLKFILEYEPTAEEISRLKSSIPALGRYRDSVAFLESVTSGEVLGLKRFFVMKEYLIALSELLRYYKGPERKIICTLTAEEKEVIREELAVTIADVKRAELIEAFTEHDTAAAEAYLKFLIAKKLPRLAPYIEAVHFALTSENVMGNVFGLIGNDLVYHHFLKKVLEFCLFLMDYADKWEEAGPLIFPALTHEQAAELSTFGKKIATPVNAINNHIKNMLDDSGNFKLFSGILNGATGNFTAQNCAYPDIDWLKFSRKFVEKLGLFYEDMTYQCVSYSREAFIFSTVGNILNIIIKFIEDFINSASCPSQLFIKIHEKGAKGSSSMPGKSNMWGGEGAVGMLRKALMNIQFLANELPNFRHDGNMKRSFLFRDVGNDFMPIFIALNRVTREMKKYVPNRLKIDAFINEYPGMSGSVLQTLLKMIGIEGDAYRLIQAASINPDSTYANQVQFNERLKRILRYDLHLPEETRSMIMARITPGYLTRSADQITQNKFKELRIDFAHYFELIEEIKTGQ